MNTDTHSFDLIVFPLAKRTGRIRRVAYSLSRKSKPLAELHWKKTVITLIDQMKRAGVPQPEIESQIHAFFDAVQSELNRMASEKSFNHPGGAA